MSLINKNSIVGSKINNELTAWNNKWDIAIFPLGYKITDAISGGDKIDSTWWFVIVCTLECHVGYNHKQDAPKGTNV